MAVQGWLPGRILPRNPIASYSQIATAGHDNTSDVCRIMLSSSDCGVIHFLIYTLQLICLVNIVFNVFHHIPILHSIVAMKRTEIRFEKNRNVCFFPRFETGVCMSHRLVLFPPLCHLCLRHADELRRSTAALGVHAMGVRCALNARCGVLEGHCNTLRIHSSACDVHCGSPDYFYSVSETCK